MNILISGGCKNGKSMYAQKTAQRQAREQGVPLYYLATMIPADEEDRARVQRHIRERDGWGFTTLEQGRDICQVLEQGRSDCRGSFLLDSVTALLANEMFRQDGTMDEAAPDRVVRNLTDFALRTGNTIFVSDSIYGDALQYDSWTECYRKGLAAADRALAEVCDQVIEVTYGSYIQYK